MNNGSWKALLITILVSVCLVSYAGPKTKKKPIRFPHGCSPVGYQFDYYHVIFKPAAKFQSQTVYFIHNLSNKTVKLLQSRTGNDPYIIHINSSIMPNRWSVFATDEKATKFICAVADGKGLHDRVINCSKVLDICEFPMTRFGGNHRGNYWPLVNHSRKGAMIAMRYHGVLLVDPKKRAQDKEDQDNKDNEGL